MTRREAKHKELEAACGDALTACKSDRGGRPGPGFFDCLSEKGSPACKALVTKLKERRHDRRRGD